MVSWDNVTTASTWRDWNVVTATSSATTISYASTAVTWRSWTSTGTTINYTSTSATNAVTWTNWNVQPVQYRWDPPVETAEQRLAREIETKQRREAYEAAEKIRKAARRVAISKADALLESVLDAAQREQLAKDAAFLLRGQSGKVYRVRKGRSANVDEIDAEGRVVAVYCAHPALDVPDGDTLVAQKLMLQADEAAFLKIANRHSIAGRPPVCRDALEALLHG